MAYLLLNVTQELTFVVDFIQNIFQAIKMVFDRLAQVKT